MFTEKSNFQGCGGHQEAIWRGIAQKRGRGQFVGLRGAWQERVGV